MASKVPDILARLDDVDDNYIDQVSQIRLEHWSTGRVALVGDAAACVSLLAGEGTGLAIIVRTMTFPHVDRIWVRRMLADDNHLPRYEA